MHTVQTFILRLLFDPEEPDALRGALQPIPQGETLSFVGEAELLARLRQLLKTPPESSQQTVEM